MNRQHAVRWVALMFSVLAIGAKPAAIAESEAYDARWRPAPSGASGQFELANPGGSFSATLEPDRVVATRSLSQVSLVLGHPATGAERHWTAQRNEVSLASDPVSLRFVNTPGELYIEFRSLPSPPLPASLVIDVPLGSSLAPLFTHEPLTLSFVDPAQLSRVAPDPQFLVTVLPAYDSFGQVLAPRMELVPGPEGRIAYVRITIDELRPASYPVTLGLDVTVPGELGTTARALRRETIEKTAAMLLGPAGALVSGGRVPDQPQSTLPDVNDTLRITRTAQTASLAWNDAPGPYNVYRGDVSGRFHYDQTCRFFATPGMSFTDDDTATARGHLWYYLVSRTNAAGDESVIGRDSAGNPIPNSTSCTSPAPWWSASSPPSKPYVLIAFPTDSSMSTALTSSAPSCAGYPSTRIGHARCALRRIVQSYSGEVEFGFMSGVARQTGCSSACYTNCSYQDPPGATAAGCGTEPDPAAAFSNSRKGGNLVVKLRQDDYWDTTQNASNTSQLLSWTDNNCGDNAEFFTYGGRPNNGQLRDAYRYLNGTYVDPFTSAGVASPLTAAERSCRPVIVIQILDSEDTCDVQTSGENDPADAAAKLLAGVTAGTNTFSVKTYVVRFVGGSSILEDAVASAGGTGTSWSATDEASLVSALNSIVGGTIQPEVCDNVDNNCNGQVDEVGPGQAPRVYCDVAQTCCAWNTTADRTTCLTNYKNSITSTAPKGDVTKLPCTSAAQAADPTKWLCYDPGESCDNIDNNCRGGVDEGVVKCGYPLHCPQPEICNGLDDNCDGQIDEGGVCGACVPSPEVCDGCDNDCDGLVDDNVASVPCAPSNSSPNCQGIQSCAPPVPVAPGGCVAGRGWLACNNSPQAETCDGLDNNCNGLVDDGGVCPCPQTAEICNGVDDNCNGQIDENVPLPSVYDACGVSRSAMTPECTSMVQVACVGGHFVCTFPAGVCDHGGCANTPEVCDALDNNCNGLVNENVPAYGAACASDDGQARDTSPCRTTGTRVCDGPNATKCSAVRATCDQLPAGCEELCDGVDNDCDGLVDEPYTNKGTNAAYFVKPTVTKVSDAPALWIGDFEASRPNGSTTDPGYGNGYNTTAQPGFTRDRTAACTVANRQPWSNVTGEEADQACAAMGGFLCSPSQETAACQAGSGCVWAYAPRGSACAAPATTSTFCNLGLTFDYDIRAAGDQDGVLTTRNQALLGCYADWSGSPGNAPGSDRVYDLTGNLAELAKVSATQFVLIGGSTQLRSEDGARCDNTTYSVNNRFRSFTAGFRCCFSSDPRQ